MLFVGSVVLAGSLVCGLVVLFVWLRFTLWGPGVHFILFVLSQCLVLALFFCLFWPCRVGVHPRWLELFFSFFFGLLLFFGVLYDVRPLHPGIDM
jgi:hypothetical protein